MTEAITRIFTLSTAVRTTLRSLSVYRALRWYVRYFPSEKVLMPAGLVTRVNDFFKQHDHSFAARTIYGYRVTGSTADIIQRYVYLFGAWEPNLSHCFRDWLSEGDTFVDVGANIGFFSLLASRKVGPTGRVVSIEPSPSIDDQLTLNIAHAGRNNIRLVNCAASDHEHSVRIYRGPNNNLGATSSFAQEGFTDEGEVPALPLSKIIMIYEMERARVVKIDVEGAELEVVKGLLPMLRYARKDLIVVVEVGGGPRGSPSASESASKIIPLMLDAGFSKVYRIENSYDPVSYISSKPAAPVRVLDFEGITSESDLIFSRQDLAKK